MFFLPLQILEGLQTWKEPALLPFENKKSHILAIPSLFFVFFLCWQLFWHG